MNRDLILHMFSTVTFRLFIMALFISGTSILMPREAQNQAGSCFQQALMCKIITHTPLLEKPSDGSSENQENTVLKIVSPQAPQMIPQSLSSGEERERFFRPIILQACNRYRVDPALVKAVIMAESAYNPRAVSKKGAKGLMQLMPGTADSLGVNDMFDPEQNINGGVKYLKQLLDKYDGDVHLALAAYNAGSKKVRKYRGIPPFKATRYYIKKIYRYYGYYKKDMMSKTDNA